MTPDQLEEIKSMVKDEMTASLKQLSDKKIGVDIDAGAAMAAMPGANTSSITA